MELKCFGMNRKRAALQTSQMIRSQIKTGAGDEYQVVQLSRSGQDVLYAGLSHMESPSSHTFTAIYLLLFVAEHFLIIPWATAVNTIHGTPRSTH